MLRTLAILVVSCGPTVRVAPLSTPVSLADTSPAWTAGERTAWSVFWRGVAVGRADLVIDQRRPGELSARSVFRTGQLARAFASVHYDLATVIAGDRVTDVAEHLETEGTREDVRARISERSYTLDDGVPRGLPDRRLHSLQSALGVIRTWSRGPAPPGFVWVLHRGSPYRVDVFSPVPDEALAVRALRVDGIVRRIDQIDRPTGVAITLWLAANRDRTPLRFTIDDVSAEAIESTASFRTH